MWEPSCSSFFVNCTDYEFNDTLVFSNSDRLATSISSILSIPFTGRGINYKNHGQGSKCPWWSGHHMMITRWRWLALWWWSRTGRLLYDHQVALAGHHRRPGGGTDSPWYDHQVALAGHHRIWHLCISSLHGLVLIVSVSVLVLQSLANSDLTLHCHILAQTRQSSCRAMEHVISKMLDLCEAN